MRLGKAAGTRARGRARAGGRRGVLLWGAALLLGGCAEAPARGRTHHVAIRDFRYAPEAVAAAVGDTLVWVNEDLVPHTATAEDGSWDTGSIASGESMRVVVEREGVQRYLCTLHPTMRAEVTAERRVTAPAGGRPRPPR